MTVQILLKLPAGGEQQVTLPDNIGVGRLVPALVSKLNLASYAEDGSALQYELIVNGQTLPAAETLSSAGVTDGTTAGLQVRRVDWTIAAPRSAPSDRQINSRQSTLNSRPVPEAAHRQEPFPRDSDNGTGGWGRPNWRLLLFIGFILWRAIASLIPSQSEPRQTAPLFPTSTRVLAALPTPVSTISNSLAAMGTETLINDFVDSPVFVADQLYFLFEDELGYGLWQIDFSVESYEPKRIITVSERRNPTNPLVVNEGVLFFEVGASREMHYLIPGAEVAVPLSFAERPVGHAPVRLQDDLWLFTGPHQGQEQQLFAYFDVNTNEILQAVDLALVATPISSMITFSNDLIITRTVQILRPLPVLVNPFWYKQQATLEGVNYFEGVDETGGAELWRTDGTIEGTFRVKDIRQGSVGSRPTNFIAFDGFIFFTATNNEGQIELWQSDGTETGTKQLFDQNGGQSSAPENLHIVGDQLFYSARQTDEQRVFWRIYSETGRRDLVDSPLSMGWQIDVRLFQFGSTADSQFHIASSSRGQSLIIRQPIGGNSISWSPFLRPTRLLELHTSGDMVVVMDTKGQLYEYRSGAFADVAGLPLGGEVVPLDDRGFAYVSPDGELWLVPGLEAEAELLLDLATPLRNLTASP